MIYKNIQGRLGNQMFQYASAKAIMKKNGINGSVNCCFKDVYKRNFENDLRHFKLQNFTEVDNIELSLSQKIIFVYIKFIEFIIQIFSTKDNFEERRNKFEKKQKELFIKFGLVRITDGYVKIDNLIPKHNYIISGGLESYKYFSDIRKELLEEFTPKKEKIDTNRELYDIIESTNSVCISIRRGDFLNSEYKDKHYVCGKEYIKKAVKLMNNKLKNPQYIIFSDDVEWCKENIDFIQNPKFETGNDPVWEKLRMMYSCKNFIISNSTFSWWAQYLSRNENKIVIAPNKWKNYGIYKDIYEEGWELIDV